MYPWYRESVGQFCAPGNPIGTTIKTENGYNDCMLALDYAAQTKVRSMLFLEIWDQSWLEACVYI